METLLRFGEWGTEGNCFFFTVHRLQVFLLWTLNKGVHPVFFHVIWQSLLGIAGTLLVTDITLKLTGKRFLALLAGVLWALNPIEVMYEFTTLQDSLVNFGIILSFWSFLAARKHHFAPLWALGAGVAAGVAATGRPVATLFALVLAAWNIRYLYRRKLSLKRSFPFAGGILAVWLIFSGINFFNGADFTFIFNPVPYAVSVNTPNAPQNGSSGAADRFLPLVKTACKMTMRIPRVWSPVEIPENLNIYFLRTKIPFLRIPFEEIILCAAAATLLLLLSGKWKKKESLVLLPVFSLVFFICIREPIGRYRLLMLPWFTILTVFLISCCKTRLKALMFSLLTVSVILFYTFISTPPLRAADHGAWGWALEKEAGKITPEVLNHFLQAYLLKPEPNNAISLITRAMRVNNRTLAEKTAQHWINVSGKSTLACYYGALTAFPRYGDMKVFLDMVKPQELPLTLRFRYYIMSGDVHTKHNSPQAALQSYKSALQLPAGTPAMRSYAVKNIKRLEKKND